MKMVSNEDYLAHHGIKGQKWGVRRFRNPDGTLNAAGKKRYAQRVGIASSVYEVTNNNKGWNSRNIAKEKLRIAMQETVPTKEHERMIATGAELERYEHNIIGTSKYDKKEYERILKRNDRASAKYSALLGQAYLRHRDDILNAKLKDLKLPQTEDYRVGLLEYRQRQLHQGARDMNEKWGLTLDTYKNYTTQELLTLIN